MTHEEYLRIPALAQSEGKPIAEYCRENGISCQKVYNHVCIERNKQARNITVTKVMPTMASSVGRFSAEIGKAHCEFTFSSKEELALLLEAISNV